MIDATVNLLKCGRTFCPAMLTHISSEFMALLGLALPHSLPPPSSSYYSTPLALPLSPTLAFIVPKQNNSPVALLQFSSIALAHFSILGLQNSSNTAFNRRRNDKNSTCCLHNDTTFSKHFHQNLQFVLN